MIFNVTGGGGAALNFKVLAYATEEALLAATPAENTIGIITETPITGWLFSATEPSPAAAGMVWITIGTSSSVEFNALKKNGIQVYPISAKQYVSGAWVDVTAKSYQGGEWVGWITYIVKGGVIGEYGFASVTEDYSHPAKMTQYDGYIYLETSYSGYGGMGGTVSALDLTNRTKVTAVIDVVKIGYASDEHYPALVISTGSAFAAESRIAIVTTKTTGLQTIEVDVSDINQECWIGIRCNAYGNDSYTKIKIYDIYVQ